LIFSPSPEYYYVLPIAQATAFLIDRAGRRDEAGARTLAEALGRLPLALDHASIKGMCPFRTKRYGYPIRIR
jgi:hypothetical protein